MERVKWIEYKEKKIIFLDFSNLSPEHYQLIAETLDKAKDAICANPPNSILVLTDMSNSTFDKSILELAKSFMASTKTYVRASAMVGLRKLVAVAVKYLNALLGRSVKTFHEMRDAKEWLISQG